MVSLRVLTLNCWGIVYVSKHRASRYEHIASYLAEGRHDIVALQEVWSKDDYHEVKRRVSTVFPHSHYFYSGVIGSGLCVFSRWPIEDIEFEPFQVQGAPYKVWQGDWMGGKGVAMCVIRHPQHGLLHFFTTHMVADYDCDRIDSNQSHRVCQAFQTVRFIHRRHPRFTIICGDFNAEPQSPSYNLIASYGQLTDAWLEVSGIDSGKGYTCNLPANAYTPRRARAKRIDHVFYSTAKNESEVLKCRSCEVTMGQIPDRKVSYSDHSAVSAEFDFAAREDEGDSKPEALPRDSLTVAEKLASMGLQTANNRRQQQMVGLLFFLSMWFTLTAFSWFPYILSVISFDPVAVDTFALSSPLVGILQSIAAVLGLMFALLAFIVTQIEIYKMTQLQQEIKVQCELDSQK